MRSFARYVVALAAMLASVSSTRDAGADVIVRGETTRVDAAKLDRLVRLELGDATDIDHVVVTLEDEKATIVLERREKGRRESVVALARGGDVERTIALLVGEASREQDIPTSTAPPAARAAPAPAPAPAELPRAATPPIKHKDSFTLFAGAATSVFASGGAFFYGATFGGDVARERLAFGLRGSFADSSADDPLGSVDARLMIARPSVSYRLLGDEVIALALGAGVDAALIGGSATGPRTHSASGFGVGPSAYLEGKWTLAKRIRFALGVEGGWLAPGLDLRAQNRTVLAVSGTHAGARLDMGVTF